MKYTKVFVNGTFDVLHYGHFKLLEAAAQLGDKLYVAIDTDERIKEKKGEHRPFHNIMERKEMLESIVFVDKVFTFDSDEELINLMQMYQPDYMIIGSDYKDKSIIGSEYIDKIIYFDRIKNKSTTEILNYGKFYFKKII